MDGNDPWPARFVAGGFMLMALVVAGGLVALPALGMAVPVPLSEYSVAITTILGTLVGYLFGRASVTPTKSP